MKDKTKKYMQELMALNADEKEYLDRFEGKQYVPELLFRDDEIINRIKHHPMALWKCSIQRQN